jgi:hypothetical protein
MGLRTIGDSIIRVHSNTGVLIIVLGVGSLGILPHGSVMTGPFLLHLVDLKRAGIVIEIISKFG